MSFFKGHLEAAGQPFESEWVCGKSRLLGVFSEKIAFFENDKMTLKCGIFARVFGVQKWKNSILYFSTSTPVRNYDTRKIKTIRGI